MSFDIDATDVTDTAAALGDVDALVERAAGDAVEEAGAIGQDAARTAARRHRRTGRLERGTTARVTGDGADTVARVRTTSAGVMIVAGTRAHAIRPIAGEVLRLPTGVVTFAARVNHPGTRPDPFMGRALGVAETEIGGALDDTAHDLAAHVADQLEK